MAAKEIPKISIKKIFFGLIIIVAGAGLLAILLELALRVFLPNDMSRAYQKELPPIYYRFKPGYSVKNYFKINQHQFRGRDRAYSKDSGTARILVFGDSTAFGWNVNDEENFAFLTEKKLNENGATFAVFNFAVPGYNLAQEIALMEREIEKFSCNLVVLSLMSNDLQETFTYVHSSGTLMSEKSFSNTGLRFPGKNFLRRHSWLYAFLGSHLQLLKRKLASSKKNLDLQTRKKDTSCTISKTDILLWEKYLLEAKNICSRQGADLVVLLHPHAYQLASDYPIKVKKGFEELFNFDRQHYAQNTEFQDMLRSLGKKLNIKVIDLLPVFRQQRHKLPFSEDDYVHPNKTGHEIIAGELSGYIRLRN